MKPVFVLSQVVHHEGGWNLGVFSTLRKAQEAAAQDLEDLEEQSRDLEWVTQGGVWIADIVEGRDYYQIEEREIR